MPPIPDDGAEDERDGRDTAEPPACHALTLERRDGRRVAVSAREGETMIEAAGRAGVSLPFGCLTGACATCAGRVLDGDVVHDRPPRALKPRHVEDGYALLCLAEPRTDCRIAVGSDVQTDLVSNPWR